MTGGVNLLPLRYRERMAERRRLAMTAAALGVFLLLLGVVAFSQSRRLDAAQTELEVEQTTTGVLQARRVELTPFRELADGVVRRQRVLTTAMATEISWAGLLTNVSGSFPVDASLTSFSAESGLAPTPQALAVEPGNAASPVGSASFGGYSVSAFAPGLATALQLFNGVSGLSEVRLQAGTLTEIGEAPVTSFEAVSFVDAEALTGRYLEGLPPEYRIDVPPMLAGLTATGPAAEVTGRPG